MMVYVAYAVCPAHESRAVPVVFASRYGEAGATLALLRTLARREPLSATAFSHSVHNAQAGLFSIAARNQSAASAVAAGGDTFGAAFLEAIATMQRGRHHRALLVVADETLPEAFARFQEEPPVTYAVAIVLGRQGIRLDFKPTAGPRCCRSPRPHALQFVDWLESSGGSLTLGTRRTYTWTRLA